MQEQVLLIICNLSFMQLTLFKSRPIYQYIGQDTGILSKTIR